MTNVANIELDLNSTAVDKDQNSNPAPKNEFQDTFANDDEKKLSLKNQHELDTLRMKQGFIGRLTGSSDHAVNTVLIIGFLCMLCIIGSMVGVIWKEDIFFKVILSLTSIISAIVGYIFGNRTQK